MAKYPVKKFKQPGRSEFTHFVNNFPVEPLNIELSIFTRHTKHAIRKNNEIMKITSPFTHSGQ